MAIHAASYTEALTGKPRISYEEFLALPDDLHAEWVDGEVVLMPSVSLARDDVVTYLVAIFRVFLGERPIGRLLHEPFQMRNRTGRAPDLMVLLNEHADRLRNLFIEGPADLVIEVVSPSGARRDYVEKLREYEEAGVPEYWIVDPEHKEVSFFLLGDGRYELATLEEGGVFRSRVLEGFWLRESWLWEQPTVLALIAEMLG